MTKKSDILQFLGDFNDEKKPASQIAITSIRPDPKQPRKEFNDERHSNLVQSISEMGVLQPILIRETGETPAYEIISGERRWRAAKELGLKEIPAFIRNDLTPSKHQIAQIVENTQRADLSDFEFAQSIKKIMESQPEIKQLDLAKIFDRPKNFISRLLSMLDDEWLELTSSSIILKARVLEQFKTLSDEHRNLLVQKAKESNLPITSEVISQFQDEIKKTKLVSMVEFSPDNNLDPSHDSKDEKLNPSSNQSDAVKKHSISVKLKLDELENLISKFTEKNQEILEIKISEEMAIKLIKNMGGKRPKEVKEFSGKIKELLGAN